MGHTDTGDVLQTFTVLCIIVVNIFHVNSEITTGEAKRRANLDNKISDFRMLWGVHRRAAPLCIGECSRDERCASVFYNKVTGHCQAHSVTFGDPVTITDTQNYRYYVRPFGEKYIGDACIDNSACITVDSECREGLCQCEPGYSFSPRTHECKVCENYGNDYWEILDHFISKRNMETINNTALLDCFQLCNSRTNYTCVSLEYGRTSQTCHLANITVLHFPDRWKYDSNQDFGISYYQRDCD